MVWTKLGGMVAALLMCATGCANASRPGFDSTVASTLTFDPSEWTDPQVASIYHAASRWNALAGHELVQIQAVDGTRPEHHIRPATLPEHYSGMHSPGLDTIRIDVSQADDNFETVVVHELGHAMGMEHIAAAGIMYKVVDGSIRDFTQADHQECERTGWCSGSQTELEAR